MKIAVTYEAGLIYQHFGHTAAFKLYEIADGKIVASQVVDTNGSGHGALAGFLADLGVDALICGGIGGGARSALAEAGIAVYGGVFGDADEAAEAFAAGILNYDPCAQCSHHDSHHGEGHTCGSHGCGSHSCH
ncbi:MAG: dinitrogenase iron-molybdenum cofactor biosynthesis protein [Ruminococcaceae bacterium]|nr:dinitrogenase iron-molybdenum cofactor biosynthesis protein [Oscillospiraceae bacterium]